MTKRNPLFFGILAAIFLVIIASLIYIINKQPSDPTTTKPQDVTPEQEIIFDDEYDVIVIGGEPEGVAAAVSAARNGAKTLLIEHCQQLGGLFTYGMMNYLDIPQGEDGKSVSKGIFQEWHHMVGSKSSFGIEEAQQAFQTLVDNESNQLTLLTETKVKAPILEDNTVIGVRLTNKNKPLTVKGKTFIDATQDADFAVTTGVPYFIGSEDINLKNKLMSVTLMIHLKKVNWEGVKEAADSYKFGWAEVTDTAAWGFSDLNHAYQPVEKDTRLRGLNLAKVDDEYFINALLIFGVDGLDEESKQEGLARGKRESEQILRFMRQEFPGFEQAEIAGYPEELYVRETRHILSEYQLPMTDVWKNKDHYDNIGYGAYPVDIQAQTPEDYGTVVSNPKQYAIPFRSLVPQEMDGLLVVGRSSGYSSLAAGSARIVPTGMTTGEAAGVAAALSIEEKPSFRELSKNKPWIETLRARLAQQGAFVEHITTDYPYQNEWYDESIQTLINYGLINAGYENDLRVNQPASETGFIWMLKAAINRVNPAKFEAQDVKTNQAYFKIASHDSDQITREDAAMILADVFLTEGDNPKPWQSLIDQKLISEETSAKIPANQPLTMKEVYAIQASVIDYLKQK